MTRLGMMLVSLTLLAGCSGESVSTDNSSGMDEAEIRMIAGELAIQKGISLCATGRLQTSFRSSWKTCATKD